jgi:hypothetical protein
MLKILVVGIAILIAAANGSAQTKGTKRYVSHKAGVVRVGPTTTYLKEGLSTDQVVRLLGEPSAIYDRTEKDLIITTYEFPRAEGRVLMAEFVSDVLVDSRIERRAQVARLASDF